MRTGTLAAQSERYLLKIHHDSIRLKTRGPLEFVDLTDEVRKRLQESGIRDGFLNVQTTHTTAAILINEKEPLLLEDMRQVLATLVREEAEYRHNDLRLRAASLLPDESPNGHAHCRAMLLRTSETLNVVEGALALGRWQRIFLVELDRPRERTVSVMVMGTAG